ncbi:paired immunoglobulin-like type 2 receptor beta isoform X1 [Caretta caretta]|uniref:paired immunoglobulin-like type 2 receptor beta isoform X1 n=1 Tax=Caretta caretta TaxID=8467 RepID=UPI003D4EEC92
MSGELLMLMLLPLAGAAAQDPRYQITQPGYLSAPAGGSVTLPCNFTYPREIEPLQDLRVYWRLGFFGQFIYNHTERFTRPDYGGRIVLVGDPRGSRMASIRIARLWVLDAGVYVCHITVRKNNGQWEQWRHHPGTQLTVTGREAPSPTDSTWHREMVTTRAAGAGRTCPWCIDTVHLVLIGLVLVLSKAGICFVVFALGRRRGWGHGPQSVTGRVSGSDAPSASGFKLTCLAQSSPPGIPGE